MIGLSIFVLFSEHFSKTAKNLLKRKLLTLNTSVWETNLKLFKKAEMFTRIELIKNTHHQSLTTTSVILSFSRRSESSDMLFIMVAYEKFYFQSFINNQNIYLKNNIAQLYFILGTSELHLKFYSTPRDSSDIHRFAACFQ